MSLLLALFAAVAGFDSTRVTGAVVALASGHPLAGVQVTVGAATAITDTAGAFALTVPAGGRPVFRVEWAERSALISDGDLDLRNPVRLVIDTEADDLRPLIAQWDWHLPGEWGMTGFFARRGRGYGQFFTRDDFRSGAFATLRALLEANGVGRGCVGSDGCGPTQIMRGRKYAIFIWVDGVIQTDEHSDDLSLEDVAGVEYYPPPRDFRPASVSPDRKWIVDTRYFLGEPLRGSMVIVWTRGFDRPKR
jgi:hypothetical protein